MSEYKIGKDIQKLEHRILLLEEYIKEHNYQYIDNDELFNEKITIEMVSKDGTKTLTTDAEARIADKECQRWKSFPDFRWHTNYYGKVYLVKKGSSEQLIFDTLQTGTKHGCSTLTVGNTNVNCVVNKSNASWIVYAAKRKSGKPWGTVSGRKAFRTWVKFRNSDGSGYNVEFSCWC